MLAEHRCRADARSGVCWKLELPTGGSTVSDNMPRRTPSTVLLMADTRVPSLPTATSAASAFSLKNLTAHGLAFYLNLKHACLHREEFLYFHLASSACHHPLWGERHPSYCKLPAIAEALARGYDRVVFLDSDAFIRDASLTVPSLLRRYGGESSAAIEFGWDAPYSLGPNAGFAVFKRSGSGVNHALRLWWNLCAGDKGMEHPYEQHALHWALLHLRSQRKRLRTLPLRTMDPAVANAEVKHLDHNAGRKTRVWEMARAAAETLLSTGSTDARASAASALDKWLPVLRSHRGDLKYVARAEAVQAVMQLVSDDLKAMLASKRSGCVPAVEALNATNAAMRRLHWEGSASAAQPLATTLVGLPLTMANCSAPSERSQIAPWQTWRVLPAAARGASRLALEAVPSLCVAVGATRSPRNPYQVLATLEPCAATAASRGDSEGAEATRARTRLGVPAPTTATAAAGGGSLQFIRSAMPPEALRRVLPELRVGCGFWSNCSGTDTVLPKPCWGRLATNVSACGTSEPAVNNLMRRTRWGGHTNADASWSRVSIGPAGPVAAAALARGGAVGRLCLSTWRAKIKEGSPAVFAKCPPDANNGVNGTGNIAPAAARQRKTHRGRWESARAFEWQVRSVGALTRPTFGRAGRSRRGERMTVTLHSSALPHLCLTAPPLLP